MHSGNQDIVQSIDAQTRAIERAGSVGNSAVVQIVDSLSGSVATTTTLIPLDDTIPQITEGSEFLTISITPRSATNKLYFDVNLYGSHSAAGDMAAALFVGSTPNALAAAATYQNTATGRVKLSFLYSQAAGTTDLLTFRVRAGGTSAGTFTFNGSGGARQFGGIFLSSIRIIEMKSI